MKVCPIELPPWTHLTDFKRSRYKFPFPEYKLTYYNYLYNNQPVICVVARHRSEPSQIASDKKHLDADLD